MAIKPKAASLVEGQGRSGQDRVAIFTSADALVAVVADGAGGTAGGGAASTVAIEQVRRAVEEQRAPLKAGVWSQLLLEIGIELEAGGVGHTTAAIAATNGSTLVGASVGDSDLDHRA